MSCDGTGAPSARRHPDRDGDAYDGLVAAANPSPTPAPSTVIDTGRRRGVGRWPFGVLVVAVLRLLDAFTLLAIGLGISGVPVTGLLSVIDNVALTRAVDLVAAGLTILGVIGLLLLQRWGWVLTMVVVGLELLAELIRVAQGTPDHLGLALLVVTAFYLNGSAIRAMAGAKVDPEPPAQP
jgi:hypothetical protein